MKPVIVATIILLIGGSFGNFLRYNSQDPDRPPSFSVIPMEGGGYFGEERRFSEASYDVLKADTTTLRLYKGTNGASLWLFIAYFSSQKYGSQIHSPKHCLPGGGWVIEKIEEFAMPFPDRAPGQIYRVTIKEEERRQLMFYWFETRSGEQTNEYALKWDLVKNAMTMRPTDAAFVRLTIPLVDNDIEGTTKTVIDYFSYYYPSIRESLPFRN